MIPCGLKKKKKRQTILIVIRIKTSMLTQCGIGNRSGEKGEVLFSVWRQEAGMHRAELSSRAELSPSFVQPAA